MGHPRWPEEWISRNEVMRDLIDHHSHLERIGLPHDGQTFTHEVPGECARLLEELRDLGYRVPGRVIEDLHEEEQQEEVQR